MEEADMKKVRKEGEKCNDKSKKSDEWQWWSEEKKVKVMKQDE